MFEENYGLESLSENYRRGNGVGLHGVTLNFFRKFDVRKVLWFAAMLRLTSSVYGQELLFQEGGFRREFVLITPSWMEKGAQLKSLPQVPILTELEQAWSTLPPDQQIAARLELREKGTVPHPFNKRFLTREIVLQAVPDFDLNTLANLVSEAEPISYAPGFYQCLVSSPFETLRVVPLLRKLPGIISAEPALARLGVMKSNDPLFPQQWHLSRPGTETDAGISSVWARFRGRGVVVAVVDNGIETTHPDLVANMVPGLGYDFNDYDSNGSANANSGDSHGTLVAGIVAATTDNGIGVAGIAHGSKLASLRLLSKPFTDREAADAMVYSNAVIDVVNNSWGAYDDGRTLDGPGVLMERALEAGVRNGRSGLGAIYVFAGGNGRAEGDNANYDGYVNSIYTIGVGAVNDLGEQASYSEPGACLVVSAPSGNRASGRPGMVTCDVTGAGGVNSSVSGGDLADKNYTRNFDGTSCTAPFVSGVIALLLEANPGLGWRDVQEILIRSARKIATRDLDWWTNSAGFHFNHRFGAGMVDASNAVSFATNWHNLRPAATIFSEIVGLNSAIPENGSELLIDLPFTNGTFRVEHAVLAASIEHASRGQLSIELISPSGTVSRMAEQHQDPGPNYANWKFMSVRHWGEDASGVWKVRIRDHVNGITGVARSFKLQLSGTAPEPASVPGWSVNLSWRERSGYGNGNGRLDPGEIIGEDLIFQNNLFVPISNAVAVLTVVDPQIQVLSNRFALPLLLPGQSRVFSNAFAWRVARASDCGHSFELLLTVSNAAAVQVYPIERLVGSGKAPALVTNTFVSGASPASVPDLSTGLSDIQVPGQAASDRIEKVKVSLRINHPVNAEIEIALRHPDGTEIVLSRPFSRSGSNFGAGSCGTSNLVYTVFDDDARVALSEGTAPFAGTFIPENTLRDFRGKTSVGEWTLRVSDLSALDQGSVLCWSLEVISRKVICQPFDQPPVVEPLLLTFAANQQTVFSTSFLNLNLNLEQLTVLEAPKHGTLSTNLDFSTILVYSPVLNFLGTDIIRLGTTDDFGQGFVFFIRVQVEPDSDGDQMPDSFEVSNGLNPNDSSDAFSDADQDFQNALNEFRSGTSPTNASSVLSVEKVVLHQDGWWIGFPSSRGKIYEVQKSLDAIRWETLGAPVTGTGEIVLQHDPEPSDRAAFYRVKLLP